jgi:hypothetical protein
MAAMAGDDATGAGLPPSPRALTWPDVDPARHRFDPAAVPAVVAGLPPAAAVPTRPASSGPEDLTPYRWAAEAGARWGDAMTRALVGHYGAWAAGWRWARDEGDGDGGPVGAWCCPAHTITTPEATLAAVAAGLVEWRGWLEDLAERFARFLPLPDPDDDDARAAVCERAAAHLVTAVVDRTGAGSAWYGHCVQVLGWFLTAAGIPPDRSAALAEAAVGGRFGSWVGPPETTIAEVATSLAASATDPPGS